MGCTSTDCLQCEGASSMSKHQVQKAIKSNWVKDNKSKSFRIIEQNHQIYKKKITKQIHTEEPTKKSLFSNMRNHSCNIIYKWSCCNSFSQIFKKIKLNEMLQKFMVIEILNIHRFLLQKELKKTMMIHFEYCCTCLLTKNLIQI